MSQKSILKLLVIPITLIGLLVGWAGGQHGLEAGGLPVFMICVIIAFALNWLAFIPAYIYQTEKFYDLTGSLTYITLTLLALTLSGKTDPRSLLLGALVIVWALRLGSFLFQRIRKAGKDDRFDQIKPNFFRFLNAWSIQALWVVLTAAPALIAITSTRSLPPEAFAIGGLLLWLSGFIIEVMADQQKTRFRQQPENAGQFIRSGLWSRSRHPNYFGEIVLWIGITLIALPVLQGSQWIALISPLFVIFLLTRVSGIPLLEAKADKKWGGQPDYEAYKKNTPILIPKL